MWPAGTNVIMPAWVIGNNLNTVQPYNNSSVPMSLLNGPFSAQAASISDYLIDLLNVSFINTLPALTSSGKLTASIFY